MDILDIFLNKYSYKFPKGYPDMNNEQDVLLMEGLLSELGVKLNEEDSESTPELDPIIKDTSPDTQYDEVIKLHLKVDKIPQVIDKYKLGTVKSLNKDDEVIFSKLYGVTPPTKKNIIGDEGSKGSGNGEISMYWLFKYQNPPYAINDTRGGNNPDLTITSEDGIYGIEIKTGDDGQTRIGRIGGDTESLKDLNIVLGIDALISNFQATNKKLTPPNSTNVNVEELKRACEHIFDLYGKMDSLEELASVFGIDFIKSILIKLKDLKKKYSKAEKADDLAAELLRSFIKHKIKLKPGYPGYIVTVSKTGPTKYIEITKDVVENLSDKDILENARLAQGSLTFKADLFKVKV